MEKTKNELDKKVSFKIVVGDSTQKTILERVLNGEYSISESQIFYEKKKWFFFLAYSFIPQEIKLDYEKILGVDLGVHYAICAASNYQQGCLKIYGDEVISFAKKEEARKWALQKQAVISGDGRIGHGTKTRVSYAYKSENKISNFRDTINHRYSKALIDFAVKNGFGTIQMEDLSGIKESRNNSKRLSHWTYFDLQTKIEYKAKEKGIAVVKINPAFTSQRCSKCGCIDENNRPTQEKFKCVQCGFEHNADINAAINISIKNIDKIIYESTNANTKRS